MRHYVLMFKRVLFPSEIISIIQMRIKQLTKKILMKCDSKCDLIQIPGKSPAFKDYDCKKNKLKIVKKETLIS